MAVFLCDDSGLGGLTSGFGLQVVSGALTLGWVP